ncbi:MAG: hypothetical protein HYR60_16785 [Acidobacteria bacterium]|nr:hypothetical protein [Acidobacteriota bacterium]
MNPLKPDAARALAAGRSSRPLVLLLLPLLGAAQPNPDLRQIVERIERLERENQSLKEEVRALREQIAASVTPVQERVDVHESRIEEQAQSKVEAAQRFPIRITGMLLANAFLNSKQNAGVDNPTIASLARANAAGGATLRQTVLGFEYHGPQTLWNGQVRGSLFLDFFGGGAASLPLNNLPRIRTASLAVDWRSSTLLVGQEKPLFSPRDPDSLAQVGVSPLTGSGNLWLWEPQARFEQRFKIGERAGVKAQVALVQTTETSAAVPANFAATLERYRPGLEGRLELATSVGSSGRIEIAPGFHTSTTHVAGTSVPSRVISIDWLISPVERLQFTGTAWTGQDVAHFGVGAIRQGFTVLGNRSAIPVHSQGGWGQLKIRATDRLSFHLLHGLHDDRNQDLRFGGIARNQSWGANFFYRLAPNVIFSFETLQLRTTYLGAGRRLNNHYDLGFAYLF